MKNTIKIILTSLVLVLSFFALNDNVYAEVNCDKYACATCVYSNNSGTFTYDIQADGNGSLIVDFQYKTVSPNLVGKNSVNNQYFIDGNTNKIVCYPISFVKTSNGAGVSTVTFYAAKKDGKDLEPTSSSTNNNKNIIPEEISNVKYCDFSHNLSTCTVTATANGLTSSCTGGFNLSNNELTVSDFGYGTKCPEASLDCTTKGGKFCGLTKFGSNIQQGTEGETGSDLNNAEFVCNYTGQITGKSLKVAKFSDVWKVVYPDGKTEAFDIDDVGRQNTMPSSNCEDVFYVVTLDLLNNRQVRAVDVNSNYADVTIAGYCRGYGNEVEQFCANGLCKIKNPICGTEATSVDDGESGCPKELRPIIVFIKRVVFNTLQIFVPIILIIMGTVDLIKAMTASDDKTNKDAISKFIKRVLAAVFMFFIVTIVNIVINMFADTDIGEQNDWEACWYDVE